MVDGPLEVRMDRHLQRLFGLMALTILFMGVGPVWATLTDAGHSAGSVTRPSLIAVFWIPCLIPFAFGFVYFHFRRWSLTSDAVRITGLFRRREIPWTDVASLRIDSLNEEGNYHKITLERSDGEEFTLNMAEVVLKGKGRVPARNWRLPDDALEKTEIVGNPAPNWGALAVMGVCLLTMMVWVSVLLLSMAPR